MANKKEGFLKRIAKFFKEVRSELKKVIWPTRKQLVQNTLTVVMACLVIGGIIWIADFVFNGLLTALLG